MTFCSMCSMKAFGTTSSFWSRLLCLLPPTSLEESWSCAVARLTQQEWSLLYWGFIEVIWLCRQQGLLRWGFPQPAASARWFAGSRDDSSSKRGPFSSYWEKDPLVQQRHGWEAQVPHVYRVRRGTERARGFRLLIRVFRAIEAPNSFSVSLDGAGTMTASQSALLGTMPTFESLAAGFYFGNWLAG